MLFCALYFGDREGRKRLVREEATGGDHAPCSPRKRVQPLEKHVIVRSGAVGGIGHELEL
ncbi:hypothetical protein GCM10023085_01570 [Actinomadura viridis]